MKIVKQIRDIYTNSVDRYERLSQEIKDKLKPQVEERGWFFLSRVKKLESFALKIETGWVADPAKLEDFFACTIVVPTISQISQAEDLIRSYYDFGYRRPESDEITKKTASSFVFDDLRLYMKRRPLASGKEPDLNNLVFEVQVKTILQHAWSIATHDLIYKSDSVRWSRERIAFQVKAMLEHAEIAIEGANLLADTSAVAKMDIKTSSIIKIIEKVEQFWSQEQRPQDIKRLAEILFNLLRVCDFNEEAGDKFEESINAEKTRTGLIPVDLSPYAFTVQALANSQDIDFKNKFIRGKIRTVLLIHDGMDLPEWMREPHSRILNVGVLISQV